MYCWGHHPRVVFVFLGVTLDSAETPFAKAPFPLLLTFLGYGHLIREGASSGGFRLL